MNLPCAGDTAKCRQVIATRKVTRKRLGVGWIFAGRSCKANLYASMLHSTRMFGSCKQLYLGGCGGADAVTIESLITRALEADTK
jgi:hypothetical protein